MSKRHLIAAALAAATLFLGAAATAAEPDSPKYGPVEERDVVSGKARLDPRAGYIFVQAPTRLFGTFLRVPDDSTRVDYQKDWDKAFAKAQKSYASALVSWDSAVKLAAANKSKPPAKPEEPTRETFRIGAIELRDVASYGPMFIYNKAPDRFTYLTALKPGTYIYYGMVSVTPDVGAMGTCNCMGTVKFEVKPGTVTDLGNSLMVLPQPQEPYDVATHLAMERAEKRAKEGKAAETLAKQALVYGLPDSLKDWPVTHAEFTAQGKVNNYYGLTISRMAPIPGILAYRRDAVIDARTGTEVSSLTIYTQVKIKK